MQKLEGYDLDYQNAIVEHMDKFGLGRWSVRVLPWSEVPDKYEDADAVTSGDTTSRFAKFAINPDKCADRSDTYVSRCALHEVTHILTKRLEEMARSEDVVPEREIDEEIEAIAKAMERAFYGMVDA